jgi:hypothetical protein
MNLIRGVPGGRKRSWWPVPQFANEAQPKIFLYSSAKRMD